MRLLAVFALALVPLAAVAESEEYRKVGMWDISYESEKGGCAAIVPFEDDTIFIIGAETVTGELLVDMAIMNPAWKSIVRGQDYEVSVVFDDNAPWPLTMTGNTYDENFGLDLVFETHSDDADRFIEEFAVAEGMRWSYRGNKLGSYSLADSREAFETAMECTSVYLDAALEGALSQDDSPFSATPPEATGLAGASDGEGTPAAPPDRTWAGMADTQPGKFKLTLAE